MSRPALQHESTTDMADSDGILTLESAVKRGPGNYVRMRPAQVNARAIGRVLNLFPESVFLVADDGSVELSNDDGRRP